MKVKIYLLIPIIHGSLINLDKEINQKNFLVKFIIKLTTIKKKFLMQLDNKDKVDYVLLIQKI